MFSGTSSLTLLLRLAEIFGTVIVSCIPALSTFWIRITIDSALWSSIRGNGLFSFKNLTLRLPLNPIKTATTTQRPI